MVRQALRGLLALVILLVPSGCDNVAWGGVDVNLRPPPPVVAEAAPDSTGADPEIAAPEMPPLPVGPVLFMGSRTGSRVSLRPIAEISGDSLIPFVSEAEAPGYAEYYAQSRMGRGSAFTLFAEGTRVGTVRADTLFYEPGFCSASPVLEGTAELVAGAGNAARFIALPEDATRSVAYGTYRNPDHTYEQRVASIDLASAAIARTGAIWPESVLETRGDMQGVPLDGDVDGAVAATFLYRDALAVGPSDAASAYSIFVLGEGGPVNYTGTFTWYRRTSVDGKGAARLWEQADWDGDGQAEILLQVFGEDARWAAALDRRNGTWTPIFEENCGTGSGSP